MSGRPRILTVSNYFDTHRGGLEIVAGRLARELGARGFSVTWLASDAAPPPDDAEAPACIGVRAWNGAERRLGVPWPLPAPAGVARLWREAAGADAILLHDCLYPTSIVAALAARAHRRPLVVVQHIGMIGYRNPVLRGLMALANRLVGAPVLRSARQVVFVSSVVRDYFAPLGLRSAPELVFNGVDTELFRPGDGVERLDARRRLGLAEVGPVVLFVGRFVEKKGLASLRCAAQLRPDLTFAFAGWGLEDPAAWGLANVRVFSGLAGAGLAELYRASDVFALPSRGEGFPLVVQEALAAGLPVICGAESARADPLAEALLHGLDVEGEPRAVAARLCAAVDAALAGARDAGPSVEFVRRRYGWRQAADRYAEILTRVIGEGACAPSRMSSRKAA